MQGGLAGADRSVWLRLFGWSGKAGGGEVHVNRISLRLTTFSCYCESGEV